MRFLATEIRAGGEYAVTLDATNWNEAQAICVREGWALSGELVAEIPASDNFGTAEADALVKDLNDSQKSTKQ